jgi:hypothetical protein
MYAWVLRNSLVIVIDFSVCSYQPFDWHIINLGDSNVRDFSLQDESDIVMEYWY